MGVSGWCRGVRRGGRVGRCSRHTLFIPDVPLTLDTLQTLALFALRMALVGLMDSLMTAKLVYDVTDTHRCCRAPPEDRLMRPGVDAVVVGGSGPHGLFAAVALA